MKEACCVFRIDDVHPAMDWSKFYRIKAILDKEKIKPLIGVIPDNQDKSLQIDAEKNDFWVLVRELQKAGWTVAQHGYQHVYVTKESGILQINARSEFAGLSYAEQAEKIEKGKRILEDHGIQTDIFMAPAHSYDENTLIALKKNGFHYVTDGYTRYPYERMGLKFIPCMHVLCKKVKGLTTCCIHSNPMSETFAQTLEDFIRKNRRFIMDYRRAMEIPCRRAILQNERYFISLNKLKRSKAALILRKYLK